jgi:hypothetical protein
MAENIATATVAPTTVAVTLAAGSQWSEYDYATSLINWSPKGHPVVHKNTNPHIGGWSYAGNMGSACFAMSTDLQTSNGIEISGLNAEEQSDISLLINWSGPQSKDTTLEVYTYIDAMIVLRENNVIEMIQ